MLQFKGYMAEPLFDSVKFCHQIKVVSILYHLPESTLSAVECLSGDPAKHWVVSS